MGGAPSELGKSGTGAATPRVDSHAVTKRLQSELMGLMSSADPGISAFPDGDSLFSWLGTIAGGHGTVYEGLTYKLSLKFPTVRNVFWSVNTVASLSPVMYQEQSSPRWIQRMGGGCIAIPLVEIDVLQLRALSHRELLSGHNHNDKRVGILIDLQVLEGRQTEHTVVAVHFTPISKG